MTAIETSPGVTIGTSNNNNDQPGADPDPEPIATQARAQTRARPTLSDGNRELIDLWTTEAGATFTRLSGWLEGKAITREHPASIAAKLAYAKAAPMAGHSRFLRFVQRADAYMIAIPGGLVFYAAAWVWDRPLRRTVAVAVVALVWLLH